MTEYDVKRLAEVFAIQAEIEGMKIDNDISLLDGSRPTYDGIQFSERAEALRNLASKHDHEL